MKTLFIIWLASEHFRGATLVYDQFIHPTLLNYEDKIDMSLDTVKSAASESAKQLGKRGLSQIQQHSLTALASGYKLIALAEQADTSSTRNAF